MIPPLIKSLGLAADDPDMTWWLQVAEARGDTRIPLQQYHQMSVKVLSGRGNPHVAMWHGSCIRLLQPLYLPDCRGRL